MKMMVGRTWKAKITAYCAPSGPSAPVMMRPHTELLPSGPNTKVAPMPANPNSRVMPSPSVLNTRWPTVVFSTINANTTCRPTPHATVVQSIAAGAERDRRASHQLGVDRGDEPGAIGGDEVPIGDVRQPAVVVHHARIAALRLDDAAEALETRSGSDGLARAALGRLAIGRDATE